MGKEKLKQLRVIFKNSGYEIIDGYLYRTVQKTTGETTYPISNFVPYIVREEVFDDGSDSTRYSIIGGIHSNGYPLPHAKVSYNEFISCNWVTKFWGLQCNIEPIHNAKEYLRYAIQLTAERIETELIFGHLGFRKINKQWIYIHGTGAVGKENITVDIPPNLQKYNLNTDLNTEEKSSLVLLNENFCPLSMTIPLLGITYLSPLNEFLKRSGFEPKTVLFLSGKTGSRKSTLAALFLSHFGNFTNTDLPLSFRDTENSIIEQTFLLKDILTVIDDYHPSSKNDELSMTKTAQTIMRAYGDRVGKSCLRSDSSLITPKPPRGNAIITGEYSPDISESGTARYLTLELRKEDMSTQILSELQAYARDGCFIGSMKKYIQWLIDTVNSDVNTFVSMLSDLFIETRTYFQIEILKANIDVHGRIPEAVSWLYLGFYFFLLFSQEMEFIDQSEAQILTIRSKKILVDLAVSQNEFVYQDRPTDKFLHKLKTLFDSKSATVEAVSNPLVSSSDSFIGYEDENYFYLITDVVHKKARKLCEEQGENFTVSSKTLLKHLAEDGLIESRGNERTLPIRVGGQPKRLMWLKKKLFLERVC